VLGAVMLLASPVVMMVLRLDSLLPAVLLAIAAVPLTIQGGQAGILQGERRWLPLALLYLAMGVPRVLIGTLCILWMPTETGAMLGITLGLLVPAAVGWWVLRRGRVPGETSDDHRARAVIRETILGSLALLAFFVLSNTDIVIARNVLDSHQAGLYAGGLILTKAVLFLPQFVVVVAFPSMSTVEQRRTTLLRSLALVSLLGALCTVGAVVLSGVAMVFIGGQQYVDVESRLWMFAILGTMLSMLQLLVYSVLARQGTRSALLVGAAVAAVLVASLWVSTLGQLVTAVTIIDALLFATLLALSLWRMRALDTTPAAAPTHVQV
jgi:O-antigen/teichoic acid export membrane protein